MRGLDGRVVLITGAARRVGAEIARTLHAEGARIVIHFRASAGEAQALADQLNGQRPDSARLVQGGFSDVVEIERLAGDALAAFGRIDALVHNASSFYATPVGSIRARDWNDLMGPNLMAPLFLAQALAPELTAREGAIVSIADIHAERPLKGHVIYNLAKAGLVMLTRSLARELAPAVRVNAVAPGTVLWPERGLETKVKAEILAAIPKKREGRPEDIAAAVRFFLCDAPYVTGQVLAVDGGRSVVP